MKYVFIDCRLLEGSVERHNPFLFLDDGSLAVGFKPTETDWVAFRGADAINRIPTCCGIVTYVDDVACVADVANIACETEG